MIRKKALIAAAAAAVLGTFGLFATAPAQALPLSRTLQVQNQVDQSMVTPVHSKKRYYRKRHSRYHAKRYSYGKRYRYRHRPAVTFSFGLAPGFYYGSSFHPRFRIHAGAPYHCHKWRDRFGHRQRTCHRHH